MKLLSIKAIISGAERVIKRFPVAMLVAAIGTGIGIYLIHIGEEHNTALQILLTLTLAAPLYVGAVLLSEAKSFSQKIHWGIHTLILLFLLVYYFLLPVLSVAPDGFFIRHGMWAFGFVLVVTFIPFVFQKQKTAIGRFWQYNRGLIFALALTAIWAGALQAGISIALASIDFLFDIHIDEELYAQVWVTIVGLFSSLFFLSRLPEKAHELKSADTYPKEVRLFSQYVLVPLVTVYFLILYAYTVRIIVNFDWPEGQLAWMILGFSFLGVLAYLALHPLREKEKWIKHFGTGLFVAMIPQTGMLFWALSFRLREYGFTENRYFILVFGIWLLVMALYYLFTKVKDIRVIPISLFVIAVLASFGPWGAFDVAERSQVNRLESILNANSMLEDGLYVQSSVDISIEDEVQINEIVEYLAERHGLDSIEAWFGGEDLDGLSERRWDLRDKVIEEKFGLTVRRAYEARIINPEKDAYYGGYINVYSDVSRNAVIDTAEYKHVVIVHVLEFGDAFEIDGVEFDVEVSDEGTRLFVSDSESVSLEFDLASFLNLGKTGDAYDVSQEDATIDSIDGSAQLILRDLYGRWEKDGGVDFDSLSAFILLPY
jgi:hypothetical protein